MWKCSECGERHADHFSSCWKCAGLEAAPRSFKVTPSVSMACHRCSATLNLVGTQRLADEGGGRTGLGALLAGHDQIEAYMCPRCGRLELFVVGVGEQFRAAESAGRRPAGVQTAVETLLREGYQLETRSDLEAAVVRYQQIKTRYPGTEYAREAEERLCAIRTKFGI